MAKKTKTRLNLAEKADKGKDPNDDQRGLIVQTGTPLWQRNGRKRHIQFKAGKMYVIDNMVHPDLRKGYICIDQDYDHVMHFCWMERDAIGIREDDLTLDPYDSIFKRVTKCTTGRVYVLKIRSTNKNYFFWMQEPSSDKDSEICAKVNYLLNFPPPWLRFPHIACNLEVPKPLSDESCHYSCSADESNIPDLPVEPGEALGPSKQKTHNILVNEIIDHLQSDEKIMTRKLFRGVPENISLDRVNFLMEDTNVMKQLMRLLPILDVGKKSGSDYTDQSNSFDDEIKALADAVRSNGNLGQIMRNLQTIETSVDTTEGELPSDTDTEYADAEEGTNLVSRQSYYSRKLSGQGEPDPPKYHEPRDHNVNKLAALLPMNVKEKLKFGLIERSLANHEQQTFNKPRSGRLLTTMEVPSGSKGNHETGYIPAGNKESSSQSKTNPDESGIQNESMEKWESAIEPNLSSSFSEARNNKRTQAEVIYRRTLSMESSCLWARPSIQSSYSSLAGEGGALGIGTETPTMSNPNHNGDEVLENRESVSGRNIHLNQCKTKNHMLENLAPAIEPIHQNEHETRNLQKQENVTYEREVSCEGRYPSACPSVLLSYESASSVGIDGTLDVHKAVLVTPNSNARGVASREGIHECEIKKRSPEICTPVELNFKPSTKSYVDESTTAGRKVLSYYKGCDSINETNIHFTTSLEKYSAESLYENTASGSNEGSVRGLHDHSFPKVMTFQTALVTEVSSKMGDSSEAGDENNDNTVETQSYEISGRQTVSNPWLSLPGSQLKNSATEQLSAKAGTSIDCSQVENSSHDEITAVVSEEELSSNLQRNHEKSQADRMLINPDVSQSVLCVSIGVGTTITQSISQQESPGCSTQETEIVTSRTTDPNRSGRPSVDVGCATILGKLLLPITPENISAQPECSNLQDPTPIKSLITYNTASGSEIPTFSSTIATLLGSSQKIEDVDDDTIAGISDLSRQSNVHKGEDGGITEIQEIFKENVLDEDDHERLHNDTVAMIALSNSGKNINADGANKTLRSSVNESLLGPGEMDRNTQTNMDITPGVASDTSGTGSLIQLVLKEPGLSEPNCSRSLKASNIAVPEDNNSKNKKAIAPNLSISRSLEDVIYGSGPSREGSHNLQKRPKQRVDTSHSGPIMNPCLDGYGKRLRTSSPGVPVPPPFRVPEASPVRSNRARYPRTSGSTCLRAPNLEGTDLRKRQNQDVDQTDSDDGAPPIKTSKISNDSPNKTGASKQPGNSSPSGSNPPVSSSSGSGSSLGRSSLNNRTARVPKAHNTSKDPSLTEGSSPRYNLRRRSNPMKTEDEQQTEPVKIREIRKTGPETRVRARTNPHNPMPRVQHTVDGSIRDQSQNTRPVLIEDKKGSKSKTKDRKPSKPDENPQP